MDPLAPGPAPAVLQTPIIVLDSFIGTYLRTSVQLSFSRQCDSWNKLGAG